METVQIKVTESLAGYGFYAFVEGEGEECAEHGWDIQEAIEFLLERLQEERAAKADPKDGNFVYELKYNWK